MWICVRRDVMKWESPHVYTSKGSIEYEGTSIFIDLMRSYCQLSSVVWVGSAYAYGEELLKVAYQTTSASIVEACTAIE